jgi:hypothetical protein
MDEGITPMKISKSGIKEAIKSLPLDISPATKLNIEKGNPATSSEVREFGGGVYA